MMRYILPIIFATFLVISIKLFINWLTMFSNGQVGPSYILFNSSNIFTLRTPVHGWPTNQIGHRRRFSTLNVSVEICGVEGCGALPILASRGNVEQDHLGGLFSEPVSFIDNDLSCNIVFANESNSGMIKTYKYSVMDKSYLKIINFVNFTGIHSDLTEDISGILRQACRK